MHRIENKEEFAKQLSELVNHLKITPYRKTIGHIVKKEFELRKGRKVDLITEFIKWCIKEEIGYVRVELIKFRVLVNELNK